jgi:predicted transcriptional regulator
MKRRSEELIIFQILDICANGAGKTRIVYQANLNSQRVDYYLSNLKKNGLITREARGSKVEYKITDKGMQLKEKLQRLQNEMEEMHNSLFDA